jgi:hypothetical protein
MSNISKEQEEFLMALQAIDEDSTAEVCIQTQHI